MIKRFNKKGLSRSKQRGFSLVELLVVITIIAILSVVAYTALGGQTLKARNSRRAQDLSTIQSALEIYFIENGNKYPTQLDDGMPLTTIDLVPKYMPKMPKDPTKADDYVYVYDSATKTYQLSSTQEIGDPPFMAAYVIGNGSDLIAGKKAGTGADCSPVVDGEDCVPYRL